MAKYDVESFLADIKATLQANLNTKIAEINSEKSDSIVLATIDNAAYVLQQLNGALINWNPFVFYGVDDIQSTSRGPLSSRAITASAVVIVKDDGNDIEVGIRMFRYLRVLEEVFKDNWANNAVKLEIKSLVPIPITNLNSSDSYRAVGVSLDAGLA